MQFLYGWNFERQLTLFEIAKRKLAKLIVSALKKIKKPISIFDNEALEQMEKYLIETGITELIHQELYETILSFSNSEASVLAVELLLNEKIKKFRFNYNVKDHKRIALAVAKKGIGLEILDMSELNLHWRDRYVLDNILHGKQKLMSVKLPRSPAFKYWLPKLNEHCEQLRHLNVYYAKDLFAIAEANFKTTLQTIHLNGRINNIGKYIQGLKQIIHNCPNLVAIRTSSTLTGLIQSCIEEDENFQCNLSELNIGECNAATLRQIIAACPKLLKISLTSPADCSLTMLSNLKLQSLVLSHRDFQDVLQLLKKIGDTLLRLQLDSPINDVIDVYELLKCCPNLVMLKLSLGNASCVKTLDFPQSLQLLYIDNMKWENLELVNFLSSLKYLQEFVAGRVFFTDTDMEKIFVQHSFVHLKKFMAYEASNLTIRSVHVLVDCCPQLSFIGSLYGWNISGRDIESIQLNLIYSLSCDAV